MQKLKSLIRQNLLNAKGWKTNRKIVVIESDDWGSIRMPSKETYEKLLDEGVRVDKCPYLRNDSLASEKDLQVLFEALSSVKDKNDRPAVLTANAIMANPVFDKISESGFTQYHYEIFPKTLERYPAHKKSFALWLEGKQKGVFYPQLHGREHLNVERWMQALRDSLPETKIAFENGVFGISATVTNEQRKSYLAALDFESKKQFLKQVEIIREAQSIFEQIFHYKSESFIAPNYTWNSELEPILSSIGVQYLQGSSVQKSPVVNKKFKDIKRHYMGQENEYGQYYMIRNASFEPFENAGINYVDKCMSQIKNAFRWKKPAVICSHRVNYIGYINEANRDKNINLLSELLRKIVNRYPEVEFMSSNQLGNLISQRK